MRGNSSVTVHPADAPTDETQALIERVSALERCQRQEDVDGFLDLFDEAAVWVNGAGRRLVGRDEIATFTRQVLPGAFAPGPRRSCPCDGPAAYPTPLSASTTSYTSPNAT